MQFKLTYKKAAAIFIFFFFLLVVIFLWIEIKNSPEFEPVESTRRLNTYERIKESGTLKAVVKYNSSSYFVYRGRPMGFEYELLLELCEHLGVNLEIAVNNDINETIDGLNNNRYDLVAQNLTVTGDRKDDLSFTLPFIQTQQVLVQRKENGNSAETKYINSVLDLAGKTVFVEKNSAYLQRLKHLSDEIGGTIHVVSDSIYGVEELITRVADGIIDYTICDENIGILNQFYHPDIDISLYVSFPQNIAWAVRKGAVQWQTYLDNWIAEFKHTRKYRFLYYKYFESPRAAERRGSEFNSISGNRISKYDAMIKQLSGQWDWRLISAIVYHESRFNENAGSWAGAYGLMQLMPVVAENYGIENVEDPIQNVTGGIRLLNALNDRFINTIPDSANRVKFVLAAYNIGLGHVYDAQRLAEKYGKNPKVWDNSVEFYLRNKSQEQYYTDEVVRFGYCRGHEATDYVRKVSNYYKQYINLIEK
jgi:membrane-bound lytic murein transglycosylase F